MSAEDIYKEHGPLIHRVIAYHARRIGSLPCFDYMTIEDIAQDLFCELWKSLSSYDPKRSKINTFLEHMLRKRTQNLIQKHQRSKRGGISRRTLRLEHTQIENMSILDRIFDPLFTEESIATQVEVRRRIAGLTKEQHMLCQNIQHFTVMELAEKEGCSRASLYRALDDIKTAIGPIEDYVFKDLTRKHNIKKEIEHHGG